MSAPLYLVEDRGFDILRKNTRELKVPGNSIQLEARRQVAQVHGVARQVFASARR